MGALISRILQKYGVSAVLEHGGESVELRIFFQPSMSKSWDSMNPIVTPLGQLPGGQYLYSGPAEQEIAQGDQVSVGGNEYILRRVETYLDKNGPIYRWALCVRKGGEDDWGDIL
jgi:hypothetical protein